VLAIIEVRSMKEQNHRMARRLVDVENLTPDEQLDLIGELWDRLSRSPAGVPLTEAQRAEIDRRSAELDEDLRAGRPLGIPWEEVLREIRSRL
jgi:putative addiction module component (TIGR02574 family)